MDFYNDVLSTFNSARNEKERIDRLRIYQSTNVTEEENRMIDTVIKVCTDPFLRTTIVAAAQQLKHSFILYQGNDLVSLRHLDHTNQMLVINNIKQSIKRHYGHAFEVFYSDDRSDGTIDSLPFANARFTLSWAK